MGNRFLFFTLFLIGYSYEVESNPCDGELFSLGCEMFEMVTKQSDDHKKELDRQIHDISNLHRKDIMETRLLINEDVQAVSKKHNGDIKMVGKVIEEKMKVFKHLVDGKLNETSRKVINKTFSMLNEDISNVKRGITHQINNSTTLYRRGLKNVEGTIRQDVNMSGIAFERRLLLIRKYADKDYMSLERKVDDVVKDRTKIVKRIHNNTAGFKKGLSDVTSNFETYKNMSSRNMENEVARLETKIDRKHDTLKKQLEATIANTTGDLAKTFEVEMESKYKDFEKESNDKIRTLVVKLKETIESDIDQNYEKMKKEVSVEVMRAMKTPFDRITQSIADIRKIIKTKGWPEGNYCLVMCGYTCPAGFRKIIVWNSWHCCK